MNLNKINHNTNLVVLTIVLILTASLLARTTELIQAKKHPPKAAGVGRSSSSSGSGGFAVQPSAGTEPLTVSATNNSAAALAIAHRLALASTNASNTRGDPCQPQLDHFILPPKEARFTVIRQCITVTGTVVWVHYFNNDGDANFNVVLDSPYKNLLGPGSYSKVFDNKYPGGPAMHMETVCQAPVTSKSKENVGACDGYNGPDFRPALPKLGQHVMVTGRYLIEMPEMPGGITELHPVYGIKILS
jgi:hypothetical protein